MPIRRRGRRTRRRGRRATRAANGSRPPSPFVAVVLLLATAAVLTSSDAESSSSSTPPHLQHLFGYQSGASSLPSAHDAFGHGGGGGSSEIEKRNDDDSFAGAVVVDGAAGLIYVSGSTYGGYWDRDGDGNTGGVHLDESDCFLAVFEAEGFVGGGGGGIAESAHDDEGDGKFTDSGMNDGVFGEPSSGGGGGASSTPIPATTTAPTTTSATAAAPAVENENDPIRRRLSTMSLLSSSSARRSVAAAPTAVTLLHSVRFGTPSSPEGCSALTVSPVADDDSTVDPMRIGEELRLTSRRQSRATLAGHATEGGYLTGLRFEGEAKAAVYGFLGEVALDLPPPPPPPVSNDEALGQESEGDAAPLPPGEDGVPAGETGTSAAPEGDDVDVDRSPPSHRLPGGKLLHSADVRAQYPAALVRGRGGDLYVASLVSASDDVVPTASDGDGGGKRNPVYGLPEPASLGSDSNGDGGGRSWGSWQTDGGGGAGGGPFSLELRKYRPKTRAVLDAEYGDPQIAGQRSGGATYGMNDTLEEAWRMDFAPSKVDDGGTRPDVTAAGLLYLRTDAADGGGEDLLVLAGTTAGFGSAFGGDANSTSSAAGAGRGGKGDLGGFVVKLDPATGKEKAAPSDNGGGGDGPASSSPPRHSVRIQSQPGRDDVLRGSCTDGTRYVYVVGSTAGDVEESSVPEDVGGDAGEGGDDSAAATASEEKAFIAKIDATDLTVLWTRQFGTAEGSDGVDGAAAVGMGCAVETVEGGGGSIVYLVGTAKAGSTMRQRSDARDWSGVLRSEGGDDLFLAAVATTNDEDEDGEVLWVRQGGTPADDRPARGGAIAALEGGGGDGEGGIVVLGSTLGGWMRERPAAAAADNSWDVFLMRVSREGEFLPPPLVEGGGGDGDVSAPPPSPSQPSPSVPSSTTRSSSAPPATPFGIFLASCLGSLVALLVASGLFAAVRHKRRRKEWRERALHDEVTKYLDVLDGSPNSPEGMELAVRGSATGGYHGMLILSGAASLSPSGASHEPGMAIDEADFGGNAGRRRAGDGMGEEEGVGLVGRSSDSMRRLADKYGASARGLNLSDDGMSSVSGASASPADEGAGGRKFGRRGRKGPPSAEESAVVREALFMDEEEEKEGGGEDMSQFVIDDEDEVAGTYGASGDSDGDDDIGNGRGAAGAGYAGLVDSYNVTWEERNPHSMGGISGGSGVSSPSGRDIV